MNLDKIENLSKNDLIKLKETIENIEIERFKNWMKSIIQDDEKTFKKLLNLGINFNLMNEKKIIEKSIRNIKVKDIEGIELLNKIFTLNAEQVMKDKNEISANYSYISNIANDIKQTLTYNLKYEAIENEDVYINLYKLVYGNLIESKANEMFTNYAKKYNIKNAEKLINLVEKYNLHETYLKKLNNIEDFKFFVENKDYKKYLLKLNTEQKDELINYYLGTDNMEILKYLHEELNFQMTNKKSGYSTLFAKTRTEARDIQLYVINKVEDVTQNKHQMLRTVLHDEYLSLDDKLDAKMTLIKAIIARYSVEQLKEIPSILKDRKETNVIKELKKYYQSFQSWADLKEALSNDSSIEQQINNPKKIKI